MRVENWIVGWMAVMLVCPSAIGQDVIVLRSDDSTTTRRNGKILQWKGERLRLQANSRIRSIATDRIIDIQTSWPDPLIAARERMAAGKFDEALPQLTAAREIETREWVEQIITAELVQCLDAMDQTEAAMIEFLKLYQYDSQTRFFYLIPLPWLMAEPYPEEGRWGRKMLGSQVSVMALMSASLLLGTPQRESAVGRLEQLANDADARIAQLATTQLWRTEIVTADETTLERWQRQVRRLPVDLRPGPLTLLAQTQNRLGKYDQAMANFMKLPILYPQKKSLAALALFRCGEILQDRGEPGLANSLRQELFRDYPSSRFAERAKQE